MGGVHCTYIYKQFIKKQKCQNDQSDQIAPVAVHLWFKNRVWAIAKKQDWIKLFSSQTLPSLAHVPSPGCSRVCHWEQQLGLC